MKVSFNSKILDFRKSPPKSDETNFMVIEFIWGMNIILFRLPKASVNEIRFIWNELSVKKRYSLFCSI